METAYKVLREFGFPVLIALGLLYMLNQQQKEASKDRTFNATILIDQIADLRDKIDSLEKVCVR